MRRNIDGTCGSSCRNPNIRTINTMDADTAGNFTIRGGNSVSIVTETNGIRIDYTGGLVLYTNTDGNLVIDNDVFTIDLANDISITGDMIIAGDLTVNGTYYTVHAEHVYTEDDYIIMRDGAVTGLGSGDFSGFQVKLYDGVNDGRLVIDNTGTARVGDVGDEQPLLTREESADLTNGDILSWDALNMKAVGIAPKGQIIRANINAGQTYAGTDIQLAMTLDTGDNDYFEITDAGTTITIKKAGNYILSYEVDINDSPNADIIIFGYIGTTLISLYRGQIDSNPFKSGNSTTIFATAANTKIKITFRGATGSKTSSLGHVELARL